MTDEETAPPRRVWLEMLYVKQLAFVSPKAPEVFVNDLDAERFLNIRSTNADLDGERVEVTLNVGVKAVAAQETVFQVDVAQAGVFMITGYTPAERLEILGRVCPETLFPFARESIDGAVRRAGFAHVSLRPLDFDKLFAQNMRERAAQAEAG
jgi:preprotein translocase subunit SecB